MHSDTSVLENAIVWSFFQPFAIFIQRNGTVRTSLIRDHLISIPVKENMMNVAHKQMFVTIAHLLYLLHRWALIEHCFVFNPWSVSWPSGILTRSIWTSSLRLFVSEITLFTRWFSLADTCFHYNEQIFNHTNYTKTLIKTKSNTSNKYVFGT